MVGIWGVAGMALASVDDSKEFKSVISEQTFKVANDMLLFYSKCLL